MDSDALLIHTDPPGPQRSYLQQWASPPTVIALVTAAGTMWGAWIVQQERMDGLRVRLEAVERDYQRRDVLAEQLRNIDARLYNIEIKLGEGAPRSR